MHPYNIFTQPVEQYLCYCCTDTEYFIILTVILTVILTNIIVTLILTLNLTLT